MYILIPSTARVRHAGWTAKTTSRTTTEAFFASVWIRLYISGRKTKVLHCASFQTIGHYYGLILSIYTCAYGETFLRFGTKLGGIFSYKSPGASYTAPGPYVLQGNEIMKGRQCFKTSNTYSL